MGATIALSAPWDGELSVRAHRRGAAVGASRASSLGAAVAASRSTGRFTIRGSLGAARLDDASAGPGAVAREVFTAAASAVAVPAGRVRLGASIGREPFDETAPLIRRGIVSTTFSATGSLDLSRRVAFSGEVEHARLAGGTPNTRTGGTASLRWRAPFVLSLASSVRAFGYAANPAEGYFAPRRYLLAEGSAQLAIGRDLGWSTTLDGGVGAQAVDMWGGSSATRPAARSALAILYRPTPGLEWGLSGTIANAASPATSSLTNYRATGVSLRGRVSF